MGLCSKPVLQALHYKLQSPPVKEFWKSACVYHSYEYEHSGTDCSPCFRIDLHQNLHVTQYKLFRFWNYFTCKYCYIFNMLKTLKRLWIAEIYWVLFHMWCASIGNKTFISVLFHMCEPLKTCTSGLIINCQSLDEDYLDRLVSSSSSSIIIISNNTNNNEQRRYSEVEFKMTIGLLLLSLLLVIVYYTNILIY